MRIDRIELFRVAMPLKEPWRTAFSEEHAIDSVFVRILADGVEGWGETAPYRTPQFSPEWAPGAFALLRDCFAPRLVGQSIDTSAALQAMLRPFKGNPFAKAALDLAWWDVHARQAGQPLWRMIGGTRELVEVGADIAVMQEFDALIARVGEALAAGFKRVKLKFRPGWGLEMVRAVRAAFPEATIHVDCNSGFTLRDMDMFRELDRCGLAMIEQPLGHDDLVDHARLQAELETPICLDESIVSVDRARKAIEIGAARWMNIKAGRVGGLTNAVAIHDLCADHDVPCWVGGMLESAVGQGPSLALATLRNVRYPCDIFPSSRFYEADLGEPEVSLDDRAAVRAPQRSGHGFRPNPERLARCTREHALIRADG